MIPGLGVYMAEKDTPRGRRSMKPADPVSSIQGTEKKSLKLNKLFSGHTHHDTHPPNTSAYTWQSCIISANLAVNFGLRFPIYETLR